MPQQFDPYENSKPLSEQQQNNNAVEMQKFEEPQPKPLPQHTQIDWGALVKDLVLKHPKEVKSLVRDLDPDTQTMVFQIIEAKYPGYSGLAKMIIGNGNGSHEESYGESYEEDDNPDNPEVQEPDRPPSSSIIQQAINDTVTMYESGMAPKDISEQIYSLYDLDWNVQTIYRVVQRHQAFKQAPAPVKKEKEEPKVIIPKEPHRGVIRRLLHWLY